MALLGARALEGLNLRVDPVLKQRVDPVLKQRVDAGPSPAHVSVR